MQIGSGHSPLSLAMLKTLGVAASAGGAGPAADSANNVHRGNVQRGEAKAADSVQRSGGAAPAQKAEVAPAVAAAEAGAAPGVDRTIPRGSFVDLKV